MPGTAVQMPINMVEVTARLASTYVNLYGRMPSKPLLTFCAGLIGVENAGGVYIWDGNVGNITAPAGYSGSTWEANGLTFISFSSVYEGMTYWWEFMRLHYEDVLVDAANGSPDAAVRSLFRLGYLGRVTTSVQEHDYLRGVVAYMKKIANASDVIVDQVKRPYVGAAIASGGMFVVGLLGFLGHRGMA